MSAPFPRWAWCHDPLEHLESLLNDRKILTPEEIAFLIERYTDWPEAVRDHVVGRLLGTIRRPKGQPACISVPEKLREDQILLELYTHRRDSVEYGGEGMTREEAIADVAAWRGIPEETLKTRLKNINQHMDARVKKYRNSSP